MPRKKSSDPAPLPKPDKDVVAAANEVIEKLKAVPVGPALDPWWDDIDSLMDELWQRIIRAPGSEMQYGTAQEIAA